MIRDEEFLLTEKYHGVKNDAFFADVERLAAGEPLAYVIGHVPFLDTTIHLDSHPLIPRPETEFWTERAIAAIKESGVAEPIILDLCAGSGAIGVAVAAAIPEAHVTFAELDSAHLPTIATNLAANDISCTRYQVFQSDLFEHISSTFDFILSNPPYIDPALNRTESSVTDFEPHQALYGGTNGMKIISTIINNSADHLRPNGELWIEHEPEQTEAIQALARTHAFHVMTHTDQYGVERYSQLCRTSPENMAQ